MFILIGFGILIGAFTTTQLTYDACKKDNFKGNACEVAKATCKVNPKNKCE